MSRSARVLAPGEVRRVLACARRTSAPNRNVVIVQLSFRTGLRACEIAGLTWEMVTKPNGKLSDLVEVAGTIAKMDEHGAYRCMRTFAAHFCNCERQLQTFLDP